MVNPPTLRFAYTHARRHESWIIRRINYYVNSFRDVAHVIPQTWPLFHSDAEEPLCPFTRPLSCHRLHKWRRKGRHRYINDKQWHCEFFPWCTVSPICLCTTQASFRIVLRRCHYYVYNRFYLTILIISIQKTLG